MRLAGDADLSSVMDELVGELDPVVLGDDVHQLLLHLFGVGGIREAEAVGEAQDVGVDDDAFGDAVGDSEDNVGGFAGGSRDGEQFGHGFWNFAVEVLDDAPGCSGDGLGFVVIEAGGFDLCLKSRKGGFGHGFGSGEFAEELRRDHIYASVGALG